MSLDNAEHPSLSDSPVIDLRHPEIRKSLDWTLGEKSRDPRSKSVAFYYAVRDGISYEVFGTDLSDDGLRASTILTAGKGFCLHKSILFATLCRASDIPCRIASAPVRNHVSSPNLQKLVGGDVFLHWFNEIWLDNRWLKVAPIFNKLLCQIYRIPPLEFDGTAEAYVQGHVGQTAMEYLEPPRVFETPTGEELRAHVARYHPLMVQLGGRIPTEREFTAR